MWDGHKPHESTGNIGWHSIITLDLREGLIVVFQNTSLDKRET